MMKLLQVEHKVHDILDMPAVAEPHTALTVFWDAIALSRASQNPRLPGVDFSFVSIDSVVGSRFDMLLQVQMGHSRDMVLFT